MPTLKKKKKKKTQIKKQKQKQKQKSNKQQKTSNTHPTHPPPHTLTAILWESKSGGAVTGLSRFLYRLMLIV